MTHYGGFAALVHKLYTERNYWSASFHPRNRREKCMKLAKCDAVIGLLELWNWKKPTALFVLWCAGSKLHWLMELHALTACDTTRNYYSRGAKKVFVYFGGICIQYSRSHLYRAAATLTQVTLYIHLSSSNNPFSISLCSLALPVEGDCDFSPRSHINTQRDEPTCVRHNTLCVSWGTLTSEESN